jgi:hypothetical protein
MEIHIIILSQDGDSHYHSDNVVPQNTEHDNIVLLL